MTVNQADVILTARGLQLGYGQRTVLRDVGFEVRRGQRWFIVGPNGHGKTTLLRGILGLLPADPHQLHRCPVAMHPRHIGFVPQRCDLNPSLPTTVREFVLLGLVGQRVRRPERTERLVHALRHVRLEHLIDQNYYALSGGQRQRALLARALVRRPGVLLLDEPTGGLDLTSQQALMDALIERNAEDGLTILFITHDIELAGRYATHVALVHGGSVHAGPRQAVFDSELLERVYGVPISVADDGEVVVHAKRTTPPAGTQGGDA